MEFDFNKWRILSSEHKIVNLKETMMNNSSKSTYLSISHQGMSDLTLKYMNVHPLLLLLPRLQAKSLEPKVE